MEKDQFDLVDLFGSNKPAKQQVALLSLLQSTSLQNNGTNYTFYILQLVLKLRYDEKNIAKIDPLIPLLCCTILKTVSFSRNIEEMIDPGTTKQLLRYLKVIICTDDTKILKHPTYKAVLPHFVGVLQQWCKESSFRDRFQSLYLPGLISRPKFWNFEIYKLLESYVRETVCFSSDSYDEAKILEVLSLMVQFCSRYQGCVNVCFRTIRFVMFRNFHKRIRHIYEIHFPLKVDEFQLKIIQIIGRNLITLIPLLRKAKPSDRYHSLRLLAYTSIYYSSERSDDRYRCTVMDDLLLPTLRDGLEEEVILEAGLSTYLVLVGDSGWMGSKTMGPQMDELISCYTYILTKKNIDCCKDLCILLHFVREKYGLCIQILRHILSHYQLHKNDYVLLRNGNLRLNELIQVLRVIISESIRLRLKQLIRNDSGILLKRDFFNLLVREDSFKDLFRSAADTLISKNKKSSSSIDPRYISKLRNVVVYCLFTEFLKQDPGIVGVKSEGDKMVIEAWFIVGLSILKWGTEVVLSNPPEGYRSCVSAFGRVIVALLRYGEARMREGRDSGGGKGREGGARVVSKNLSEMVSKKFVTDCLVRICPQLMSSSKYQRDGYLNTMLLVVLSQWIQSFQTMGGQDSKTLFLSHVRQSLMPVFGGNEYEKKLSMDVLTSVLYRLSWRYPNLRSSISKVLETLMDSSDTKIGPLYESLFFTFRKIKFLSKYQKLMDAVPEPVSDDHVIFSTSFFTKLDHEFYENYVVDISNIFDEMEIRLNKSVALRSGELVRAIEKERKRKLSYPNDPVVVEVLEKWRSSSVVDVRLSLKNCGFVNLSNVRVYFMAQQAGEGVVVEGLYGKSTLLWKLVRKNEVKSVDLRVFMGKKEKVGFDVMLKISDKFTIRCDSIELKY